MRQVRIWLENKVACSKQSIRTSMCMGICDVKGETEIMKRFLHLVSYLMFGGFPVPCHKYRFVLRLCTVLKCVKQRKTILIWVLKQMFGFFVCFYPATMGDEWGRLQSNYHDICDSPGAKSSNLRIVEGERTRVGEGPALMIILLLKNDA